MRTKNFFLTLLLTAVIFVPAHLGAQVTIGSTEPPQATLDIIGAEGETGQAFRLIDGNHTVPGRVLTLGENGIGTWETFGLTIQRATINHLPETQWMLLRDYITSVFVTPSYIYLPPGVHLILAYMPVRFNFATAALEDTRYRFVLVDGEGNTHIFPNVLVPGPRRALFMSREFKMATIDLSANTSTVRYYIGITELIYANTAGSHVTSTHPNAASNAFQFLYQGTLGKLLAIPLAQ